VLTANILIITSFTGITFNGINQNNSYSQFLPEFEQSLPLVAAMKTCYPCFGMLKYYELSRTDHLRLYSFNAKYGSNP
jgi:hypothetical protein